MINDKIKIKTFFWIGLELGGFVQVSKKCKSLNNELPVDGMGPR